MVMDLNTYEKKNQYFDLKRGLRVKSHIWGNLSIYVKKNKYKTIFLFILIFIIITKQDKWYILYLNIANMIDNFLLQKNGLSTKIWIWNGIFQEEDGISLFCWSSRDSSSTSAEQFLGRICTRSEDGFVHSSFCTIHRIFSHQNLHCMYLKSICMVLLVVFVLLSSYLHTYIHIKSHKFECYFRKHHQ